MTSNYKQSKVEQVHFIKISNKFITEGSKYHMNERELCLYSLLRRRRDIDGYYLTTIATLGEISKIKFGNRPDRSALAIKETLFSLLKKQNISMTKTNGDPIEKLKSTDVISVFPKENIEVGHIQIPNQKFDQFESMTDFYIYVVVARWKDTTFNCSFDRWAEILKVNKSTAIRKIEDAVSRGIIFKSTGDYEKENKQYVNSYSIKEFSENEKSNMTKHKEVEEANRIFREELEPFSVSEDDLNFKKTLIVFKTPISPKGIDIYPNANEYAYFMEMYTSTSRTDSVRDLIQSAETRINMLKNNSSFQKVWSEAEKLLLYTTGEVNQYDPYNVDKRQSIFKSQNRSNVEDLF